MLTTIDNPPSKLSFQQYGKTVNVEWPQSDIELEELIYAFIGICISQTYPMSLVKNAMADYLANHGYSVVNNEEFAMADYLANHGYSVLNNEEFKQQ